MMDYGEFLRNKQQSTSMDGFEPTWLPDCLFPFQRFLVDWAIRKGRASLFEDCVAAETVVNTPDGDFRMDELARGGIPIRVWALDSNGLPTVAVASCPWVNGVDRLYEVRFKSGRTITATMGHRLLTESGWKRISDISFGERILVSSASRLQSTLERGQLVHASSGRYFSRTVRDCQSSCFDDSSRDDGQPRFESSNGQLTSPSQVGARERSNRMLREGGLESESSHSHRRRSISRHSMRGCSSLSRTDCEAVSEFQAVSSGNRCLSASDSKSWQSQPQELQLQPEFGSVQCPRQKTSEGVQFSLEYPLIEFDTIAAVDYIRTDVFYDLNVPEFENYLANGVWSHNCGLGKTLQQLVWAENVVRHTNKPVMVITPLAVSQQTAREAEKFGIEAKVSRDGKYSSKIVITNYERLHYFDSSEFIGAVCDEASAIKAFDGRRRKEVTRFLSKMPYRLLATATPSPNDFIELGTESECLGVMTQSDMLGFFFKESKNMRHTVFKEGDFWNHTKYTFKPHSAEPFWRWVVGWSRGIRLPSDLGFDDAGFVLPPLNYIDHIVDIPFIPPGEMFPRPAITLREQKEERMNTVQARCERVAELMDIDKPGIAWCHYNQEGDALERLIPDAVQISGADSIEEKEERLEAFAKQQIRVLVTKPKIGCWGLNLQHCGDMTFFPTHSYEGFYQGIRRCYRFGRQGEVNVNIVASPGEAKVIDGLKKKQANAEVMFARLVEHMNHAIVMNSEDKHRLTLQVPSWLKSEVV